MARSLTNLASMFLRDKNTFRASLQHPVLIWKAPPTDASGQTWQGTHSGVGPSRPHEGEALVFEVVKDPGKQNAFPMGVTVGRIDTNDVPLDDVSVSRFHAWLQQDAKGWVLCDAESKNGTFIDGRRLEPKQKLAIKDKAKLKFGEVEVTWFSVDALIAMMEEMMRR
jgi:hypothetical protein